MAAITSLRLAGRVSAIRLLASSSVRHPNGFPTCVTPLFGSVTTTGSSRLQLRPSTTASGGHDHSKMWTAERTISAGLLGLVPMAIAFPSAPLNYALALSLTVHAHWGLEAIVVDYIRPAVFGQVIPKISVAALYGLSMAVFGGLCYFNYADVGLAQAVRMLWAI